MGRGKLNYKSLKKKMMVLILAFSMVLPYFADFGTGKSVVNAAGVTFIIHYGGREDGDYAGWNVWVWEEGKDGQSVAFTGDDDFGKVAVYQCSGNPSKIGFIVRLNEWEAKDTESDRFVTVSDDLVEIWVTSGVEEFETTPPEGAVAYDFEGAEKERLEAYDKDEALKVNVHYYTFDEVYDNTEIYGYLGDNAGGSYPYVTQDDFGGVYHMGFLDYEDENTAGFYMYINGKPDSSKERVLDLSKAKDGVLDVYTVQGNPEVWYDQEDVNYNPVIISAGFGDTTKKIIIQVSKAIDTSDETEGSRYTVTDEDGTEYGIIKAWSEELGVVTTAYIILEEPLSLEKQYTITREGYDGTMVTIGDAFSSDTFVENYYYDGDDLGAVYSKEKTAFRVWAPTAENVALNLYENGDGDCLIETINMTPDVKGTWVYEKEGDLNGVYYTYSVTVDGKVNEAVDPYARTTGVNGNRGMVIDLDATDPEGFDQDEKPEFINMTDAVIYEAHVRDLTIDTSSGSSYPGKYLGLTETGTTNSAGLPTGIDHMKDLGITHLHLLPVYDYATVDETDLDTPQFNWGYDPKNYNVPEGSYSTDPYHGEVRVQEFKEMVQTLHENDIRVVMDVVYNHTFNIEDSCFQLIVPDYYYRKDGENYTNGSGCGNEVASDRLMVRKYIVDSVVYWAEEYHVDGFRFDLMGVLDIETMQAIREALDEVDPSIIIYGEGWTGGESALFSDYAATKVHTYKMEGIAAFSDDIRDSVKGHVFEAEEQGFVSGASGLEEGIKFSVVAATENDQIDFSLYDKVTKYWAGAPTQCINYVSCHDNYTLWDKLAMSNGDDSVEDRIKMNKLACAIVFTAQGIPFLQAGEEMLRSKPIEGEEGVFSENSYNLSDYTNSIKWDELTDNIDVYNYYKGLIAFRKAHGALRMTTTEEVQQSIKFIDLDMENVVAYTIEGSPNNEIADTLYVVYNGNRDAVSVTLPDGTWDVYINGEQAGTEVIEEVSGTIQVAGISAMVLAKKSSSKKWKGYVGIAVGVLAIAGGIALMVKGNKKGNKKGKKKK